MANAISSFRSQDATFPRVRSVAYLLVIVAIGAFCLTDHKSDHKSAGWFGISMAAASISWLLVEYLPRARIPRWLVNIILLIAAYNLWGEIIADLQNDSIIFSLGDFIIVLVLCKLFESKTPRDLIQLIILSLLLVVAGAMFSASSMSFALVLVIYLGLLIYAALLLNLHLQTDAASKSPQLVAAFSANGQFARLNRDLFRMTRWCAALSAPLALVVFLCVPRARTVGLMNNWGAGMYQTGFADNVQFHDYGQLAQSDTIVMQVRISRDDENIGSEFYDPYFRGAVLDTYRVRNERDRFEGWDRLNFTPNEVPPRTEVPLHEGVAVFDGGRDALSTKGKVAQEYTILLSTRHTLFAMLAPSFLSSDQLTHVFLYNKDWTLQEENSFLPLRYKVFSTANADSENIPPPEPSPPGQLTPSHPSLRNTTVPPVMVSNQINDLAHKLAGLPLGQTVVRDDVRTTMVTFENYLKNTYPYSLSFEQVDHNLDPTTDFLVNRKQTGGHCEFFASAMVMLCRAVGIYAHVVTGFHGGEFNSLGGYYIVREKDAHAWAEVYIPGSGWTLCDPSPIRSAMNVSPAILARWMHDFAQFAENIWLSLVVSFDNDSRAIAMAWLKRQSSEILDYRHADLGMRILLFLAALVLLSMLHWWLPKRRKRQAIVKLRAHRSNVNGKGVKLHKDLVFLEELLRWLGHGAPRPLDQTPREFLARVPMGAAADDARWLVDTAYALRFGQLSVTGELRDQIASRMRHIRQIYKDVALVPVSRK